MKTFTTDPWKVIMTQRASLGQLYGWRHRNRVMEIILTHSHPERDHIRRFLESEETQAQEDAMALMRSQQLTGAAASLDIAWPPTNAVKIVMGRPGRVPNVETEDTDEEETETEAEDSSPPPYCDSFRERRDRDEDGGTGNGGGLNNRRVNPV